MKFNQWTVGLAALGVISLASAAKAEERTNAVLTALSATTISGYVDTSAQWNFGTGNSHVPPYRFNSPSKADGFNLDVVQLRIEKPLDEGSWSAGYRADLWFGPDAHALGTQSTFGDTGDFAIRQAYVNLGMPVGNGLYWKMGVFDSIIGYESIESGNNPNYTRSYGNTIEPTTHTGLLGTYRFCDTFRLSAGVADTVNSAINSRAFVNDNNPYAESYKAYMGSIELTAPDSMGFLAGSTLYGGAVNGYNNDVMRTGYGMPVLNVYAGATVATPIKELRVGVAWDLAQVNNTSALSDNTALVATGDSKLEADIWTIAGYASYQATEKLSFHARFEYATGDLDHPYALGMTTLVPGNAIFASTATVQYDLWKNVLSRLEFRWDHAEHGAAFGGRTDQADASNAFMLAANVIYKF